MNVSRLSTGRDPMYPHQYCIRFENRDAQAMYEIAAWVMDNKLPYWVGTLTGVVYVPNAKDVTLVQLRWPE